MLILNVCSGRELIHDRVISKQHYVDIKLGRLNLHMRVQFPFQNNIMLILNNFNDILQLGQNLISKQHYVDIKHRKVVLIWVC